MFCLSFPLSLSFPSGNICITQMDTILYCVIFCSLKKIRPSSNASSNSQHYEHVLRNRLLSKSYPYGFMFCFSLSLFWECICSNKTPDMLCLVVSLLAQKTESRHAFFVSNVNFPNVNTTAWCSVSPSLFWQYICSNQKYKDPCLVFFSPFKQHGFSLCSEILKVFSESINICLKSSRLLAMFYFSLRISKTVHW